MNVEFKPVVITVSFKVRTIAEIEYLIECLKDIEFMDE